jgi:[citrate (pro-3S)-lyase] ligase
VVCQTPKGESLFSASGHLLVFEETPLESAISSCRHLTHAPAAGPHRPVFFRGLSTLGFAAVMRLCNEPQSLRAFRNFSVFALLSDMNVPCYFISRPGKKDDYDYSPEAVYRMENELSFTRMLEDTNEYAAQYRDVLGDRFSPEYIKGLSEIPPIVQKGDIYEHSDQIGQYVNVVNGKRFTPDAPQNPARVVHVYGRCGVFGYAVEDGQTLPAHLQKLLNLNALNIAVVNHGLWGADDGKILINLREDIASGYIRPADAVVVYMWPFEDMDVIENCGAYCFDATEYFHAKLIRDCFYDKPGHMNSEGYAVIAEFILEKLTETRFAAKVPNDNTVACVRDIAALTDVAREDVLGTKALDYTNRIRAEHPFVDTAGKIGAIVMNCNPFTLGHRYLAETAAKEVDRLFVFVVEEDKSFFPFQDRLRLVREGLADIDNVFVCPSGELMISALTFPEYFLKDQLQEAKLSFTSDLRIFGKYIAPALRISVRFAGSEPYDAVTGQYNKDMSNELPRYGIEFKEIERLETDGAPISASAVRRMMGSGDYEGLRARVPDVTYAYLMGVLQNVDS